MKKNQIKQALVLTEPKQNVALLLREILRSMSYKHSHITMNLNEANDLINNGQVDLIVIDDSVDMPAPIMLRQLLLNPIAAICPTLILLGEETKVESKLLSSMGRPMIVNKPLSPGRFSPGLKTLERAWSGSPFAEITIARTLITHNRLEQGLQFLTKAAKSNMARSLVTPSLSALLRDSGNLQVSEKILLSSLKHAPRDVGVILALSDLYLHSAMPATSLRLIKGLEVSFGATMAGYVDKLQAYLMLDQMTSAIGLLKTMHDKEIIKDLSKEFLIRCFFTEGRMSEFLRLVDNGVRSKKISNAWTTVVTPTQQKAS